MLFVKIRNKTQKMKLDKINFKNLILRNFIIFIIIFPSLAFAKPKIVFKETQFNFGKVKRFQELVHKFYFKNEGDKILKILKIIAP